MASCSSVEAVQKKEGLLDLEEQRGRFAVNFPIQGA